MLLVFCPNARFCLGLKVPLKKKKKSLQKAVHFHSIWVLPN